MIGARRVALTLLAATALAVQALAQEKPVVAVTAIVEHPALDAARDGIKEALAAERLRRGADHHLRFESAQGNPRPRPRSRASSWARRRR